MKNPKQLELNLQVKGEMTDFIKDVPALEEVIQARKDKPKHMEHFSDKMINDLLRLFSRRF